MADESLPEFEADRNALSIFAIFALWPYFKWMQMAMLEAAADHKPQVELKHAFASLLHFHGKTGRVLRRLGVNKGDLYRDLTGREIGLRFRNPRRKISKSPRLSSEIKAMLKLARGNDILRFRSIFMWYCVEHADGRFRLALDRHGVEASAFEKDAVIKIRSLE
ncbi:MAG: hypothetical protein JSS65_12110 [Armatimonadetes bacterium]|nr:hypothetical protein [Armatimonadota bacterium]